MAGDNASASTSPNPAHQSFRRIDGPEQHGDYATFLEMTCDTVAGIHTCLDIVHSSDLQREINATAAPGEAAPPAISGFDAEKLMRLSIVSSAMLTRETLRRIDEVNQGQDRYFLLAADVVDVDGVS